MKSINPYFQSDGHLSDEGIAAWVDSQNNQSIPILPEQVIDHLEACLQCKELVIEVRESMDIIEKEEAAEATIEPEIPVLSISETKRKFPKFYRYAAALIILMTIGGIAGMMLWKTASDPADLYAANFSPYPDVVSERNGTNDTDTLLLLQKEAFCLYDHHRFDSAVPVFRYLAEKFPTSDTLQFYLAVSLLATGREFPEAITILRNPTFTQGIFKDQALWYLSLAYLAINKPDSAIIHLDLLYKNSLDYRGKATALLDEMR
jgi:hypothetical protein